MRGSRPRVATGQTPGPVTWSCGRLLLPLRLLIIAPAVLCYSSLFPAFPDYCPRGLLLFPLRLLMLFLIIPRGSSLLPSRYYSPRFLIIASAVSCYCLCGYSLAVPHYCPALSSYCLCGFLVILPPPRPLIIPRGSPQ